MIKKELIYKFLDTFFPKDKMIPIDNNMFGYSFIEIYPSDNFDVESEYIIYDVLEDQYQPSDNLYNTLLNYFTPAFSIDKLDLLMMFDSWAKERNLKEKE